MQYDVIIVGAGPSGTACAYECAKNGLKTLIIEKRKLPRFKSCGGAISNRVVKEIGEVDKSILEGDILGARIFFKGDLKVEVELKEKGGFLTTRSKFDYFLAKRAIEVGAELKENEKVKNVAITKDRAIVKTDKGIYDANVVVGADGVHSLIARKTKLKELVNKGKYSILDRDHISLSLEAEIPISNEVYDEQHPLEFFFDETTPEWGYGWIFHKIGKLEIGIAGISSKFTSPKKRWNIFIDSIGKKKNFNFSKANPRGWALPRRIKRKLYGERVLLIGDAGGFVDPFLGEGIYYAIKSGRVASQLIINAKKKNNFSEEFLSSYKDYAKDLNRELDYGLKIAKLFYNHPKMFVFLFSADSKLTKKFEELGKGELTYPQYYHWFWKRFPISLGKAIIKKIRMLLSSPITHHYAVICFFFIVAIINAFKV